MRYRRLPPPVIKVFFCARSEIFKVYVLLSIGAGITGASIDSEPPGLQELVPIST